MRTSRRDLGKLVSVYGPAPAFLQRAVFLTVLSFFFFLGMMAVFYVRQGFVYFILASAFLVIYIISLVSFLSHRKNVLAVHENGIELKKQRARWHEISSITDDGQIRLQNDEIIMIPKSLSDFAGAIGRIRSAMLQLGR